MTDGLAGAIERVAQRERVLEVHGDEQRAAEIADQFAIRNVRVVHEPPSPGAPAPYVIVRDRSGAFLGALGLAAFDDVLAPDVHPPWALSDAPPRHVFAFLGGTCFRSFDRKQMRATAREIEERAWRVGTGSLWVGFQRPGALEAEREIYQRFASETDLDLRCYLPSDASIGDDVGFPIVRAEDPAIGEFWFLVYTTPESRQLDSALVAEERGEGRYHGFWTFDSAHVRQLRDDIAG